MSRPLVADLFVEDRAHEELVRPLVSRIAQEEQVSMTIAVRCARGGHGRVLRELELYLRLLARGGLGSPDLLVVATDGNCDSFAERREKVRSVVPESLADRLVTGCPDPHVECWYLADPDSFREVIGYRPRLEQGKCERGYYKQALADAVRRGGHPPTLGGIEFARELVKMMNLYRAGKNDPSLGAFLDELRARLRQLGRASPAPEAAR
jgi:hypothetical protein